MGSRHVVMVGVAVIVLLVAFGFELRVDDGAQADPATEFDFVLPERQRIMSHLARVETRLRAMNVEHLTPAQVEARRRNVERLGEYRRHGVFPHNHVAAVRTPVFIDEHGTHCAVGYLIAESGNEALARRIAAADNLVRMHELAGDPELLAWLEREGLTLDEAAMIQPAYNPQPDPPQEEEGGNRYGPITLIASGVNSGFAAWNLLAPRGRRGTTSEIGVGLGLAQVAVGFLGLMLGRDAEGTHVAANFVVGGVSTGVAAWNLRSSSGEAAAQDSGEAGPRLSLSLWPPPDGALGLRLSLRF